MKYYIHYTLWNKAAHVPWLCEGIVNCIPKGSVIDFVLDNCTDETEANLNWCINNKQYLQGWNVRMFKSTKKYRWPNTNDAMGRFLTSDCNVFISPQDDQKLQDRHLIKNLEFVLSQGAQVIGMRDGVINGNELFSSNFSRGTAKTTWLASGEFKEVDYINDGPIALTRNAVTEIGLFDTEFWAHYADNDYCHRAKEKGYKVFVMGAEVVHEKWSCKICGNIQPSEVWGDDFSKHDYEIYKRKWLK